MLERDPEAALDRFISHTFRHILMHKCHQRGYNEENNLWKFILIFFGDSPERGIRVKTRRGRFAQLSLRDDGCRLPSSRCRSKAADARKCVYTAVRRCLHLKSTILGTRLRPVYLLKLILRVARFLKRKVAQGGAEWIDLDIKRTGNYAKDDLLEAAANFIANVLWHGPHGFPAHVALQTTLCQWRSFRADYVSEMIQIMYSMDQLGTDDKCKSLLKGFKAAVHSNLNERLFILGPPEFQGPNYAPIFRRLYAVFWILNRKRLLSEPTMQFGIDCCIVARTVATGDLERARLAGGLTDVEYVKWVITLVLLLLECASDVKRNTWLVMQIMAQYFHEGGQKCGILRCPLARPCFRCLIDYVEIYRGMHAILNLLSKSTFYPCHVNLVMQLLRNDISTVKATFFKALAFRREGLYSSYDCDDVRVSDVDTGARGSHAAPPCLRLPAAPDRSPKQRERRQGGAHHRNGRQGAEPVYAAGPPGAQSRATAVAAVHVKDDGCGQAAPAGVHVAAGPHVPAPQGPRRLLVRPGGDRPAERDAAHPGVPPALQEPRRRCAADPAARAVALGRPRRPGLAPAVGGHVRKAGARARAVLPRLHDPQQQGPDGRPEGGLVPESDAERAPRAGAAEPGAAKHRHARRAARPGGEVGGGGARQTVGGVAQGHWQNQRRRRGGGRRARV
ncbi:1-phosphatidylinositol 4-kinase, putative [Babesia caballi]|uniref:1-phosphatidylinositol 4-kinase, putative n=1 Tax=Babesia caballi TaxID=5871 RepID=A0AAV4LXN9_BABCB|nr:1-phosphatidylinositol 4-kinase, putative [Babesia caballi]